jgi:hypothetical protein
MAENKAKLQAKQEEVKKKQETASQCPSKAKPFLILIRAPYYSRKIQKH